MAPLKPPPRNDFAYAKKDAEIEAKPKKKSKPKRAPAPDFAQQSLAMVKRIIGGKLSDGMNLTKRK
jgi:hypothetical protein